MEIRPKDILFITTAGPAALVAAYLWLWRGPLAANNAELAERSASLVAVEDYDMSRRRAQARLEEAQQALEAARNAPPPDAKVAAPQDLAQAARERAALNILRCAGLGVLRSVACQEKSERAHQDGSSTPDAERALQDAVPQLVPIRRLWTLDGSYPAVKRALDAFSASLAPIIPEKLDMTDRGCWILEATL